MSLCQCSTTFPRNPLSLSAKISLVKITLRDVDYNITEEMVTFDPAKIPGATIVDKR